MPQVLGSGHGAIQLVFDGDFTLPLLLLLLVAKLLASAISLGAGFRGGMFSASLLLGCLFGAAFADIVGYFLPHLVEQHTTLMMVGMGSVAAAVIGAPLTMVFLVLEGTGNFPVTVGVLVGVVFASTIVRLTFGYSFSTWRFHQRGIGIRSPHDIGWLADLTAGRLMRADPKLVPETMPLAELREKYPPGSAKRVFVVSDGGAFTGTLDIAALHDTEPEEDARPPHRRRLRHRSRALPAALRERAHGAAALRGKGDRDAAGAGLRQRPRRGGLSHRAICAPALQPGARAPPHRRPRRTRPVLDLRAAALDS